VSTKKKPTKKSRSEPVLYNIAQPPLPGIDTDEFRTFLDLSQGVAVKNCCPKCGYRW